MNSVTQCPVVLNIEFMRNSDKEIGLNCEQNNTCVLLNEKEKPMRILVFPVMEKQRIFGFFPP